MVENRAAGSSDPSDLPPEDPSSTLLSKRYLVLLVIAAVVGVLVSLAAWCFVELIYQIQRSSIPISRTRLGYDNGPPRGGRCRFWRSPG